MDYQQLSKDYRDDVLAEALYSREVEYFHYDFDRVNFRTMLVDLPEGEFKIKVQELYTTTVTQMENTLAVYTALKAQITDEEAHKAAILRTAEKRCKKI